MRILKTTIRTLALSMLRPVILRAAVIFECCLLILSLDDGSQRSLCVTTHEPVGLSLSWQCWLFSGCCSWMSLFYLKLKEARGNHMKRGAGADRSRTDAQIPRWVFRPSCWQQMREAVIGITRISCCYTFILSRAAKPFNHGDGASSLKPCALLCMVTMAVKPCAAPPGHSAR